MYPRFSPDGKWIAFSSNRYGNNDVFVVAAGGGAPRRLTFHTGNDEVVGWSRDSQRVLFRAAHGGTLRSDVFGRGIKPGKLTRGEVQNIRGEPSNAGS